MANYYTVSVFLFFVPAFVSALVMVLAVPLLSIENGILIIDHDQDHDEGRDEDRGED